LSAQDSPRSINERAARQKVISYQCSVHSSYSSDPDFNDDNDPFIASPETQIFLKPNVTPEAAKEYGFDFRYSSRPGWETYASLLEFANEY
jgi:hypothetical protein